MNENRIIELTELNKIDNNEYKIEAIFDNAIYAKKSESDQLPGLYNLVFWKDYSKEENTWEPVLAVQYLKKLLSSFHKDHLDKLLAIFEAINIVSPMAKLIATGPWKRKKC